MNKRTLPPKGKNLTDEQLEKLAEQQERNFEAREIEEELEKEEKPNAHYIHFDFDFSKYLVLYFSDEDLSNKIMEATENLMGNGDIDSKEIVLTVMESMKVMWEFCDCASLTF